MLSLSSILILVLVPVIALYFAPVQTYVSKNVASYLSNELDAEITLDRIYFKPFSSLELINFSWKDKNGKQIVASNELHANLVLTKIFDNQLTIEALTIKEGVVNFEIYKDSTNFTQLVNYFSSTKKEEQKEKKKLILRLNKIEIINNSFSLVNHTNRNTNKGVNFSDLDITNLSASFDNIELDSILSADIKDFTLKEKSGLFIKNISTKASYSAKKMEFEDLYLEINNSILKDYLKFEYDSLKDFSNFIEKVYVTSELTDAYVDSRDIEFFAPTMKDVVFQTAIKSASLTGTVSDIKAKNTAFTTAKQTELTGDFTIKGLPNINKTVFDFDLQSLKTNAKDVEYLVPLLAKRKDFKLPNQLHQFEDIAFQGTFTGYYNDFNVDGLFHTALGDLETNSNIAIKKELAYSGLVKAKAFQIGTLVNTAAIGSSDLDLTFDGVGLALDKMQLHVIGNLTNSQIQSYNYDLIALDGTIQDNQLHIEGYVDDPNLKVDYKSTIDWQGDSPNYLLDANFSHASLKNLNWLKKDSVVIHAAKINTNLVGQTINTITGHFDADSIAIETSRGNFNINSVLFEAEGNQQERLLSLTSDVVDAEMSGVIDLNTIGPYFRSLAIRYAPAIGLEQQPYNPQNFNLEVNVKSFKPIAALIDPNLSLDDGAHLNAKFSSEEYKASFIAFSPIVLYKGMKLTNLGIQEMADEKAFSLNILADRLNFADSTYINNIAISNVLSNDSLNFNIELSEKTALNYLNLNGDIHFVHNAPANIKFKPSTIIINKDNWSLNSDAQMHVSKGKIYINNLLITQADQRVKLDGVLSNENDKLNIVFDRFSLASLNGLTNPLGINLKGSLNGDISLNSVFKNPYAIANIQTTPIIYNDLPIGKLNLKADFEPNSGLANIDMNLADNLNRGVKLNGYYNFYDDEQPLNLSGKLNETDLIIFQPFLKNLVSKLQGKGNADVSIIGTFKNPKISGIGRFFNSSFTVNYLKTNYAIDNQMAMVENNAIIIQNLQIKDAKGQTANANGLINLEKLSNPYIDVDVVGNNFMILNTTFKDNNLYYGTASATGTFKFKGYTSAIAIDIDATSEAGTSINIPFNSAMTVSESDFIYFVSKDSSENEEKEKRSLFKGLTMNMNLHLTPEAEVNLQTELGSLKGNGRGEISMLISSLGDFEMFGDYIINNGKFHFTAQDFINKFFDIKEGGTIRWTGNPSEATINLNAIYQQRTAIGPLYNAAGRAGEDERVLAQADMLIKGTLEQPDISFDLNFPQNPYIKDQLQSYLSDLNNVNQQALSLIVRRSFTPSSTNEIGREVNNTLLSAGTEIAFNQLNNIISQSLNINFFDLNIRSFNDASASVRLLDDRLVLTGGITDRTNYQATDLTFFREGVTTDAELTYRLRKDGNLILRAYNRPYTRNFLIRTNDAEYISAVGLVYRQEFNSINEFWRKLWRWGNVKKENTPQITAPVDTTKN